jgi:proteic killer suppression protein
MIKSFGDKETEYMWKGNISRHFPKEIRIIARRKLRMLNNANSLIDLKIPPSNKLEKLKGDRKDQYSIRINMRWRICFKWLNNDCYNVEIVDYHQGEEI